YADLIASDLEEDHPIRAELQEIRTAGVRASELTKQLLTFSRRQVLDPTVLNLNQTMADVEKMLRRLIGADIELTTLPSTELWNIQADTGHIEQVLMTLAVNARDAMPHGGKLTIQTANVVLGEDYAHTHHEVTAGPHVMLAVTDSGVGM